MSAMRAIVLALLLVGTASEVVVRQLTSNAIRILYCEGDCDDSLPSALGSTSIPLFDGDPNIAYDEATKTFTNKLTNKVIMTLNDINR